jgi:DNA-binding MarR family transcriptional regulator
MRPRRRIAPVVDDGLAELGCACANSRRVARMLTQLYDRHLQGSGIEAPQFALMATLDAHGPCTQTTLGRHHGMDKTTVSRNVGMLRRNGWIARSPALDRRERRIGLTPAGRATLASARPRWQQAQRSLQSAMTAGQWRELFSALRSAAMAADRLRDNAI